MTTSEQPQPEAAYTVRLFDNGGETFDRYTAVYFDRETGEYAWYRGMSENPFHPQGFGISGDEPNVGIWAAHAETTDQVIAVADAPEAVQRCIAQDILPYPDFSDTEV